MEKTEIRKKFVPGTKEIITQIKQITNDIEVLNSDVNKLKENLNSLIAAEKSSSPKAKLLSELHTENEEKNVLRNKKTTLLNAIELAKNKLAGLRDAIESSSSGYNNIDKLNGALEELELKLISSSVTSKEELEISNKMTNLKIQKNKIAENETNLKMIDALDASIKQNRSEVTALVSKISEKSAKIAALKEKLDKLSENGIAKSPEVTKLEAKLNGLKAQRDDLYKLRTTLREKIHLIEEEYAKFETELLIQKNLEEQKDVIRKNISQLKAQKDNLLTEQEAYDPKIFDSLIFTVKSISNSGLFSMNIDLVTQLMKFGIKIPSKIESLDETIEALNTKKNECSSLFTSKNQKILNAISELDGKIAVENAKMNELPPTDYEILKKGGVRIGGFRNKDRF